MKCVVFFCIVASICCDQRIDYFDVSKGPLVWFDIKIGDVDAGRIVFGLFGRTVRKTVRNFVDLAKPDRVYVGHRDGRFNYVVKGWEIAGGNDVCDSNYGLTFPKENFKLKHYGAGWVAAVSADSNSVDACRYYIILKAYHELDGRNVVFGKILNGMKVINQIAVVEVDGDNQAQRNVLIANCGTELADPPFRVARTAATA